MNGSIDRSQFSPSIGLSFSDRRLGIDRGKSGNTFMSCLIVGMKRTANARMVWRWGAKISGNEEPKGRWRVIFKGDLFARCRQTAVMFSFLLDINVQFPGVEIMDSRQYRHTCVSGTTEIASTSYYPMRHWAI